jgi:hypothetical protein
MACPFLSGGIRGRGQWASVLLSLYPHPAFVFLQASPAAFFHYSGTQELALARQVLYCWSHAPSPFCFRLLGLINFAQTDLRLQSSYLHLPKQLGLQM